jgi:hypothetical protein
MITEPPPYEALSYVWGAPGVKKEIIVDGHYLEVTVNLENALRRLRCDKPRQLWADAVCIDQNNEEEKRTQLPVMGKV